MIRWSNLQLHPCKVAVVISATFAKVLETKVILISPALKKARDLTYGG